MVDCWIYLYHLDKFFNIPATPESIGNSYLAKFASEEIMNRTAPKLTYSGSGPHSLSISLRIHSQLFALDNPETPSITNDLIKALIACAYPSFNFESSKIVPPMILLKFGEAATIRGVINSNIQVNMSGPWLKDGTMAVYEISFSVIEIDQYSADYIANFGTNPSVPVDLERRRVYGGSSLS